MRTVIERRNPAVAGGPPGGERTSRRGALALLLASRTQPLAGADVTAPLRLAISESLGMDVNANDARAAMVIWMKQLSRDLNLAVEYKPNIFDTAQEILYRVWSGQLDAVALNVVEYRQVANLLDSSQVIAAGGTDGPEQYVVLVKDKSGIQKLGDLRGHRLIVLAAPRMCVATAWLSTVLEEGHDGGPEQFFGSVSTDTKVSGIVLPVFFGKADACLAIKRGFDAVIELNPQVARDLRAVAISPPMVVVFYVFRKGYQGVFRERLVKALSSLRNTASGRQFATLFQFEDAAVKDSGCLMAALAILETASRTRDRQTVGSPTG